MGMAWHFWLPLLLLLLLFFLRERGGKGGRFLDKDKVHNPNGRVGKRLELDELDKLDGVRVDVHVQKG